MKIEKILLINKIIERKNQDISWEEATLKIVKTKTEENKEASSEDILNLSEEAKNVYLKRLEEEQYIHGLS